MWGTVVTAFLPVAIKIITSYLNSQADKKEAREAFIAFVEKMQSSSNGSVKVRNSYQAQIDRLKNANP